MSERVDLITEIEKKRNSKVICYLTGDRGQFATQISEEIVPILYRHLELIGEQPNIDLFLYTRGGDMVVPLRVVQLFKNYCKKFSILIPYRCQSAGTLISLGASEIIMTKLAELTPVDPTSQAHPFNPVGVNPQNPQQQMTKPVSVEDVRQYLYFAKEELKAKDEGLLELYSKMTTTPNGLHPLALGNVYRAQKMIKKITKRLLDMHVKDGEKKDGTIKKIINEITGDISVHNYPIYFDEAESLGLNVKKASKEEERLLFGLYELYAENMKLTIPINPVDELGSNSSISSNCNGAIIESILAEDNFKFHYDIRKIQMQQVQMPNMPQALPAQPALTNLNVTKMQWEKIR